jgi:hypothetical protein
MVQEDPACAVALGNLARSEKVENPGMSDTQVLLNQIIALRQRLEQVQGLMS